LHAYFPVFRPLDSIHLYSFLLGRTVSFAVIKVFVFTGVNNDVSKIVIVAPQQALLNFTVGEIQTNRGVVVTDKMM
jgi:hypothetical protein